ncbi:hypothetical protein RB653_007738 [Dictyostelium firmibasis]|uniref:tRNA pseudouridine(55) synthase n=1 Tax=Dictyostelium firmibasis TaxID=79012 RepID=A0AAN7TP48_9MYCE
MENEATTTTTIVNEITPPTTEPITTTEPTTTTTEPITTTTTEPITTTTKTTTTTTTTNKFKIPDNNEELIKFATEQRFEAGTIDYRNLLFRLESLESRLFKNVHFPTIVQLHSINVCPRCIFRFLNIKELSIYQESYNTLSHLIQFIMFNQKQKDLQIQHKEKLEKQKLDENKIEIEEAEEKEKEKEKEIEIEKEKEGEEYEILKYDPNFNEKWNNFVCCCCLGILQDTNNKELFLDDFIVKMKSSGYEFQNYSLALSIPMSAIIREQSIWYYLIDCFPNVYNEKKSKEIVEIKEGVKWVLGPIISRQLFFQFKPSSDFRGNMQFNHEETKDDHQFLTTIEAGKRGNKRQKLSTKRIKIPTSDSSTSIAEILGKTTKKEFCLNGSVPPTPLQTKYSYDLSFRHEPVFLAGKYNKYVRDLSQTPWEYDDSSVQDIICKDIKDIFKAETIVFTTSGREDIDVRMLGEGRPFYIEIINPHKIFFKNQDYEKLESSINDSTKKIKVSNLQLITKKETTIIKDSGGTKQKNYRCIIWTSRTLQPSDLDTLNNLKDIELKQNTPIRVLHRRSLMIRNKKISKLQATFISPHFFMLDIIDAQAGTYIKEFVHGDLSRTLPNIGQLLGNCEADILQLDVLNVDLNFPAKRK